MLSQLRHAPQIARQVLFWLVLAMGVALVSPWVKPVSLELICSGSGMTKLLVKTTDGSPALNTSALDCPLCLNLGAPPPVMAGAVAGPFPLSFALQPIPAAHIAALTGAPLPARGPPALL